MSYTWTPCNLCSKIRMVVSPAAARRERAQVQTIRPEICPTPTLFPLQQHQARGSSGMMEEANHFLWSISFIFDACNDVTFQQLFPS